MESKVDNSTYSHSFMIEIIMPSLCRGCPCPLTHIGVFKGKGIMSATFSHMVQKNL